MASPESAAASLKDWDGKKVPPGVHHALETSYRGQTGIGKKMVELLGFYEDVAVFVPTQLSITEASFSLFAREHVAQGERQDQADPEERLYRYFGSVHVPPDEGGELTQEDPRQR